MPKGRPKGSKNKKTSQDLKKETRQKLQEVGRRSRRFVDMICNKCKREYKIRVNTLEQKEDFEKIRDKWICILCK